MNASMHRTKAAKRSLVNMIALFHSLRLKGAYPPCCKIIHHFVHCGIDDSALSRHLEETVF